MFRTDGAACKAKCCAVWLSLTVPGPWSEVSGAAARTRSEECNRS